VLRRVEVRLADLQMDDAPTLAFQGAGARENFEGGLCAEA
jgi:hypothetical protein